MNVYEELALETLQRPIGVMLYADRKNFREGNYEAVLVGLRKRMRWSLRLGVAIGAWLLLDGILSITWLADSNATLGSTGIRTGTANYWGGVAHLLFDVAITAFTAYTYGRQRDTCATVEALIHRSKQVSV